MSSQRTYHEVALSMWVEFWSTSWLRVVALVAITAAIILWVIL